MYLLYRGKEKKHSEIELIIYYLKWYSPTGIISLALLVLRPKLVFLLTDLLPNPLSHYFSFCFTVLKKRGVFYTSAIPEVTWCESLDNSINADLIIYFYTTTCLIIMF